MDVEGTDRSKKQHDRGFIVLSVLLVIVYAFAMGINALAGDAGVKLGKTSSYLQQH